MGFDCFIKCLSFPQTSTFCPEIQIGDFSTNGERSEKKGHGEKGLGHPGTAGPEREVPGHWHRGTGAEPPPSQVLRTHRIKSSHNSNRAAQHMHSLPASDQVHNKSLPTQPEESSHAALTSEYQCSRLFSYRHNGQQLDFPFSPNTKQAVELNMDFSV